MTLRANLDDTALVDPCFMAHLPLIERCCSEYARISGFALNVGKTIIIFLGALGHDQVRAHLGRDVPMWED